MTSKIKVDNIENQCGGAVVTKCGATTTISGSVVKADDIQAADGGNIINQCGTTITLGASGDTINLASGASQTGFGRTGTVDWDTTPKTASFTAVSGEGYFVNTTSGAITVTLPATPSAGDIVSIADYTNTFQTNNVTVARNGSPIGGIAADATLSTEGQSVTFVYVDGTEGWKNVQDSTSNVTGNPNIVATGGTITTCGNCKIHTFTGPGTFTVSNLSTTPANNIVTYLVVGGGGGGGARWHSGGGGAGGFREVKNPVTPYTASPLDGYPSAPNRVTLTATSYPITVGAGGSGGASCGNNNGTDGNTSTFSTITAALGGRGGTYGSTGNPGGSGGGGGSSTGDTSGGTGNTPPTTPAQGTNGGTGQTPSPGGNGAGGGGAGGAGSPAPSCSTGGAGVTTCITANPVGYAGGSGGAREGNPGGGIPSPSWGSKATNPSGAGENARANSGSGGGTTNLNEPTPNGGGAGGSGIVIIRYKYQ